MWEGLIKQLQPSHSLEFEPCASTDTVETDLAHVREIIELSVSDMVRQMKGGPLWVSCHMRKETERVCITTKTPLDGLSIAFMHDALDVNKAMSDYDDANSYYLVLARMLARLIGGELVLKVEADMACLELLLPFKYNARNNH